MLYQTLSWCSGYSVPPGAQWCPASCGKSVQRGCGRWRNWYHPWSLDLNQFWVLQWIGLMCTLIIFNSIKWYGSFIIPNILQSPYWYKYSLFDFFSPLGCNIVSKCSFNFFEQYILYFLNGLRIKERPDDWRNVEWSLWGKETVS